MIFNPIRYEERYFWTLKEILDPTDSKEIYNITNSDVLSVVATMSGYSTPLISLGAWTSPNYAKLVDLICKRFIEHYCFYTFGPEFSVEKQKNFIAKLLTIIEMTSPRYLKLLEIYASESANLLNPVEISSSGLVRFNDTPQDEGDFANDSHTTNLTEDNRTTSNDLDTKMGRIREIEGNYNNLLHKWSNEFESLFIEEANV